MFDKISKYKDMILITIGTLLIIFSFCLLLYDKVELIKSNVFEDIELLKYRELNSNSEINNDTTDIDTQPLVVEAIEVEDMEEDNVVAKQEETKKEEKKVIKKEIIGYLEIKKINLKQGLVPKGSYYNHVNRNIQILDASDYPDKEKGNVILAAHSGTSYLSFFKNLYQLSLGDEAKIYYKGMIHTYKIVDIYNVAKVGTVAINRDYEKTCLTLITCTKNSKTEQTVYILERISSVKEGDSNA